MSEFECKYGHLVRPGHFCSECAKEGRPMESAYYMDGMTSRQIAAMERDADEREAQEEEDDD